MRPLLVLLTLAGLPSLGGCYYGHLADGQVRILLAREPIERVLADPQTPPAVRDRLAAIEDVRAFARDLGLSVGGQYTSYVDWPGDRIVTTLVRTRPGSLEAVPWRYPFLGALPYQGYFDRARAEAEATRLRDDEGFDVCVSGVSAYSTLGWLDDPVTAPMLARGHASLVETLFHELVHATAFLPGEADFNESVAQFIGQQATLRFFAAHPPGEALPPDWPDLERVRAEIAERIFMTDVIAAFRDEVSALDGAADRGARRLTLEASTRAALADLPLEVLDGKKIAERARLSDACLALRTTYTGDALRHAAVLEALGDDLSAMIVRLRTWAEEERSIDAFYDVAGTSVD